MKLPVLAVDPGVRGGLCVLDSGGWPIRVAAFKPSMTRERAVALLGEACDALRGLGGRDAFLEKVGYIRGDGGQGSFTFGRIYGLIEAVLILKGLKVHDVPPMVWMAKLDCLTGGNKNVTKAEAIRRHPGLVITHSTADALLIGAYGQGVLGDPVQSIF